MRGFGDVKFVSNIFHIHLTLWKVSKDSEDGDAFGWMNVWNDPKVRFV